MACSRWDHPRSRGVYNSGIDAERPDVGSSPLARGLQAYREYLNQKIRIIPARAGFTAGRPLLRSWAGDHPRSRGVYNWDSNYRDVVAGSSPLARGLRSASLRSPICGGIIPARAGFTFALMLKSWARRDHPRSRGVYINFRYINDDTTGSSPLARGLHAGVGVAEVAGRIIPARAGFTCWGGRRRGSWTDHPRSRGVYGLFAFEGVVGEVY